MRLPWANTFPSAGKGFPRLRSTFLTLLLKPAESCPRHTNCSWKIAGPSCARNLNQSGRIVDNYFFDSCQLGFAWQNGVANRMFPEEKRSRHFKKPYCPAVIAERFDWEN